MLTADIVKKAAIQYGADLVKIGDISRFDGVSPYEDPRYICPGAKTIIGCAFRIPRGILRGMENERQIYSYTSLGVKANAEERTIVFLMKMARIIENEGYEACLQRSVPHMQHRMKEGTNPEVKSVTVLNQSVSVGDGKPEPEVLINFDAAAIRCGLATPGCHGQALTPEFGPFQRFCFIITNAPLECDPMLEQQMCDGCGECAVACPGHAISMAEGSGKLDTWQCSVYYRGAHRSNPLMTDECLKDYPDREAILDGNKQFTEAEARAIYPEMDFLPNTHYGYVPCLCGKACDIACYRHLEKTGKLTKKYRKPF